MLFGLLLSAVGCAPAKRPDGGSGLLSVGRPVPELQGQDQHGKTVALRDLRGRFAVVYFYPKDQTPGCTKEACAFRDVWDRYQANNVAVVGVSNDGVASHNEFASKHALPFPLVADPEGTWAVGFGVPTRAGFYSRVSFLVGPDGLVAKVYENVDPGVHAVEILKDVGQLGGQASGPSAADPASSATP